MESNSGAWLALVEGRMEVSSSEEFSSLDRPDCASRGADCRGDALGGRSVGNFLWRRPGNTGIGEEGCPAWCSLGSGQVAASCRRSPNWNWILAECGIGLAPLGQPERHMTL